MTNSHLAITSNEPTCPVQAVSSLDAPTARMIKGWLDCCYDGDVEATARFMARQFRSIAGLAQCRAWVLEAQSFKVTA